MSILLWILLYTYGALISGVDPSAVEAVALGLPVLDADTLAACAGLPIGSTLSNLYELARTLRTVEALAAADAHEPASAGANAASQHAEPGSGSRKRRRPMRKFQRLSFDWLLERLHPLEFRKSYGLSHAAFNELHRRIEPRLATTSTRGGAANRDPVRTEIKLAIVLRWLRGGSHHDLTVLYGVSVARIYVFIYQVCRAICDTHELPLVGAVAEAQAGDSSRLQWLARGFERFTHGVFDTCIGAIDGVQVQIAKPSRADCGQPNYYYTRKDVFALNVQAIADYLGRITWISICAPGSVNDSIAYRMSRLWQTLERQGVGFFLVGDEAYNNTEAMAVPVHGLWQSGTAEDDYNYYQALTRQPVERAFGMVERRWGVLWRRLDVRLPHATLIILTVIHLHNLAMQFNVPEPPPLPGTTFRPLHRGHDVQPGRRFDVEGGTVLRSGLISGLRSAGLVRPPVHGTRRAH